MTKRIQAWHMACENYQLGYGDGRTITPGETIKVSCKPTLCVQGLHGSRRLIDALRYAPGPIICRVELSGQIIESDDKIVATHRKCLWTLDGTELLHAFAVSVARDALTVAGVTDQWCWDAITAKESWLRGEINNKELAASQAAALDAAQTASLDPSLDAAIAAAWAAAWAAVWATALDASLAASLAASRAVARAEQEQTLQKLIRSYAFG